mgnify:CR=1 FL=1
MKIRIAGIISESVTDGEGLRYVIFTQGCPHHCFGCHNPKTHSFVGGYEVDTDSLKKEIFENPLLAGVTFSGGEPFCQPKPLAELAKAVRSRGLNVWSYTGYTLEALREKNDEDINALLANLDVLVDGKFEMDLKDLTLPFRGSSNQRIIRLKEQSLLKW